MKAHGWAVLEKGEIDVKTVSPTARAAIINWLIVVKGQFVTDCTGDNLIRKMWVEQQHGARCVPVTIILTASRVKDDPAATWAG